MVFLERAAEWLAGGIMRWRCLRELTMSLSAVWMISDVEVPRMKRVFLGFSMAFGSRFSRARFERALRGFLPMCESRFIMVTTERDCDLHCAKHCCQFC